MARELAPFRACLNKAISDARPQSNEVALTIAQTSCADVAATVRLKIAEVHKSFFDPPRLHMVTPKNSYGAITMARLKAYWDFTRRAEALPGATKADCLDHALYRQHHSAPSYNCHKTRTEKSSGHTNLSRD